MPRPSFLGLTIASQREMYFFLMFFVVAALVGTLNLMRSRIGRAFIAIRDHGIAAEIIWINIFRHKLLAVAISSFFAGITGRLYTYYLGNTNHQELQVTAFSGYP